MNRAIGALLAATLMLGAEPIPVTYRADFLALAPTTLALRGGTTLRVASACACAHDLRPGENALFSLDENDAVVTLRRFVPATDGSARALGDLPAAAAITVARAANADTRLVKVTITVEVPSQTPQTDDVYLSTDRSSYTPNERRMTRIDERRWTIAIEGAAGTTTHYQYTRGTFGTLERDRANTVRPARTIVFGTTPAAMRETVERWADIL